MKTWRPWRACWLEWRCCSAARSRSIWTSPFPACLQYVLLSFQTARTDAALTRGPLELVSLLNICRYFRCTVLFFPVWMHFLFDSGSFFPPTMSFPPPFLHVTLSACDDLIGCVFVHTLGITEQLLPNGHNRQIHCLITSTESTCKEIIMSN